MNASLELLSCKKIPCQLIMTIKIMYNRTGIKKEFKLEYMRQSSIPAIKVSGIPIFKGQCHPLTSVNALMKNMCPIKKEISPTVK